MAFDPDFKYEKYEGTMVTRYRFKKSLMIAKFVNETCLYTFFNFKPHGSRNSEVPRMRKWK